MIIKSSNAKLREFKGVDLEVLSIGEKSMVTKMLYKNGDNVSAHKHPNEQSGYVISGKYRIKYLIYDQIIEAGDSYSIPANVDHTLEIIEPGQVIDFFTPPRKDYL